MKRELAGSEQPSIKDLLLLAALWMVLGFSIWFYTGALHVVPVRVFCEHILQWLLGDVIYSVIHNPDNFLFLIVQTRIQHVFPDGSMGGLGISTNPLIYGYGLPLLFGLSMATPTGLLRKISQLSAGLVVMWLVQTWGVSWEVIKNMAFAYGPAAQSVVTEAGISNVSIALFYQVGYLIFPALAPVLVWVLFNRPYIERLAGLTDRSGVTDNVDRDNP
jgi:hypothetical protein